MGATLSRHGQADEAETAVAKAPSRKNPFKACFTASQAHYGACLSKSGAFLKALRHEDDDRQAGDQVAAAEQEDEDPKKAAQLACSKGAACCATAAARVPVPPAEDEEHVDCAQAQAVTNPDTALILNMLDPENGPAAGLPYQVHWLGPPRPPCEKERLATVLALNKIREDAPADPEISTILKLVASVFKAPAALCALFDEKRVFISEQEGNVIPCGDFPWRWTLCGWSMAFKNPQILVIQDTLEDARFHNNNKVQAFPFVRFYCGAPLIAGNGHRLGTLCFADVKPRKFDMASCVMMNNLSELVVRQLEKDIALKLKERDNKQLRDTYKHLQRAMDCYEHTVVLLDIEADGWKVVYANAAWTKQTGLPREALLDHSLREVLELTDGTQLPSKALVEAAKKQKCVTLPMARLCDPAVTKTFTVSFKPAGRQALDESTMPIGVPNFLSLEGGDDDVSHRFFFMTLYPPGHKPSTVASPLMPSGWNLLNTGASDASSDRETVVSGLEVAHLLGRGSFGWVYYGTWFGTPVAVKVIDNDVRKPTTSGCGGTAGLSETRFSGSHTPGSCGAPHQEALLAHELKHPYIVATLKYATRMVPMNRVPDLAEYGCGSTPTVGSIMAASDMLSGSKPSSANTPLPDTSLLGTATSETGAAAAAVAAEGTPSEAAPFRAWAVIEANAGPEEDSEHLEEEHMSSATDAELIRACQVRAEAWGMDERAGSTHVSRGAAGTAIDSGTHSGTANHSTASTWLQQTWMVMEYCDKGCVQDAVDRGWLRTARDCLQSEANMPAVVATAFEIASAMHYLHDNDIVHGDLTGWNVMLSSSGATASLAGRGFVAKVADFGMSRNMEMRSRITTRNYGTITHMPPELLTVGTSSHAVDVYSFGVLLWQMYTGSRPWSGLTHAQIIVKVVQQRQQLQWDDHVPADYRQLAEECMSYEREARPTFDKIVARLEAMKEELGLS